MSETYTQNLTKSLETQITTGNNTVNVKLVLKETQIVIF